jgi:hypothetical protein
MRTLESAGRGFDVLGDGEDLEVERYRVLLVVLFWESTADAGEMRAIDVQIGVC